MSKLHRLFNRSGILFAVVTLALSLTLISPRDARALTIVLDFTSTSTDIFGQTTGAFDHTTYGFTGGLTNAQVQQLTLNAVMDHFLGYPTNGVDGSSPLPDGKELDIDFVIGTGAPIDPDWARIKIGDGIAGSNATNPGIFGAACVDCVRDAAGTPFKFGGAPVGSLVGSIWTDHIAAIAGLAANNTQLINLIAGTISHEIGHTLSLIHTGAQNPNPGASAWGVMGSGATAMPNNQRILEREWTYNNMAILIGAVGLRDVQAVPEPGTLGLLGLGLLLLAGRRRFFS
jgi:hypothetical protein